MASASSANALHLHDSPEWYTPAPFVEAARELMGEITLDPASHEEANQTVRALVYYSEQDNGLAQDWFGHVFLNPSGGLVSEFWNELVRSFSMGEIEDAIWIGYSLEQLQTLQQSAELETPLNFPMCVPNKRIAFVENEAKKAARIAKLLEQGKTPNKKSQPSHANYISYLGADVVGFENIFQRFGQVKR